MPSVYRYTFPPGVPAADIAAALTLAAWAAESLHGTRVRLDAGPRLDRRGRAVEVPAGTPAGRDVNRLFVGFVARAFGPDALQVVPPALVGPPVRRPVRRARA